MTTSKELVRKAIEFKNPERVPYNFDSNRTPVIAEKYGDDFEWVFAREDPDFKPTINDDQFREDEYGIVYQRCGATFGEACKFPMADIDHAYNYQLPDFTIPERYAEMEQIVRDNPDKYILGKFPHFLLQRQLDFCGFENLMISLMTDREAVECLSDKMMESCLVAVDTFADRGADGMIAIEDLGLQSTMIIAPGLWREIYKPRMAKIVQKCHARNMHFIHHCCGGILDVIDDLIEIGVDVLQIDQQDNMGINELARRFAGRICFFCPVDIQTKLPVASHEQIQAHARHLIRAFGSQGGGFMAKTYPQPEAIAIPETNTKAMCEAFKKYGVYPLTSL